jgi:plasmid stabilization system protein ParE
VPRLRLASIVRQDIRDALAFTLARFGPLKAREYAGLIRIALNELASNPQCGHRRQDVDADAYVHRIAKPGRDARHLFLYEIVGGKAQVYGFFYDGMDLASRWHERTER